MLTLLAVTIVLVAGYAYFERARIRRLYLLCAQLIELFPIIKSNFLDQGSKAPMPAQEKSYTKLGGCACISYNHRGKKYKILAEFDPVQISEMNKVMVSNHLDQEIKFFQPGIYINVTPKMCGWEWVKVQDEISGKTKVYAKDDVLGYLSLE
jgi:hypothetical protein